MDTEFAVALSCFLERETSENEKDKHNVFFADHMDIPASGNLWGQSLTNNTLLPPSSSLTFAGHGSDDIRDSSSAVPSQRDDHFSHGTTSYIMENQEVPCSYSVIETQCMYSPVDSCDEISDELPHDHCMVRSQHEIRQSITDFQTSNQINTSQLGFPFFLEPYVDTIPSITLELTTPERVKCVSNNSDSMSTLSPFFDNNNQRPLFQGDSGNSTTRVERQSEVQNSSISEHCHQFSNDYCSCGWSDKHPDKWIAADIQNWIKYIARVTGTNFCPKAFEDVTYGVDLKQMSLEECQQRESFNGNVIFHMFRKMYGSILFPNLHLTSSSDTNNTHKHKLETYDPNLNKMSLLPLWEFTYAALNNTAFNPSLIRWENEAIGTFQFVDSEAFAKLWGQARNNKNMTYEKMSRSLRYYYPKKILERVEGRRLIYRFLQPYLKKLKTRFC